MANTLQESPILAECCEVLDPQMKGKLERVDWEEWSMLQTSGSVRGFQNLGWTPLAAFCLSGGRALCGLTDQCESDIVKLDVMPCLFHFSPFPPG